MKTAKFIKNVAINSDARLYVLSKSLKSYGNISSRFVIVSAVIEFGEPETYIFPARKDGSIIDWTESPGSFKGELNHEKALKLAGYEVVK